MDGSFKWKCKETIHRGGKIRFPGTKWEYPISKSKKYWKKLCDNEEKRLIVVRNPFLPFSYSSFSNSDFELTSLKKNISNDPSSSSFSSDMGKGKIVESSLHRLFHDSIKPLPKSLSKSPFRSFTKIQNITREPPKVQRIPKLDTSGPQPSSSRIFPNKVDHTRASFDARNEQKVPSGSTSTESVAFPMLDKFPATTSGSQLTLNKLRRHLRLSERKISLENVATSPTRRPRNKTTSGELVHTKSSVEKKGQRSKYKALGRSASNKNLDLERKLIERSSEINFRLNEVESSKPLSVDDTGEGYRDSKESFVHMQRARKRQSMDLKLTGDNVDGTLKSKKTTPKTIPSDSRCTSRPSLEFASPKRTYTPSTSVLASIPKLSGYPRRNRDRCLPCLYRPFEGPVERKTLFPGATLQNIIRSQSIAGDSSEESDDTSVSIPKVADEVEKILNSEVESRIVTFNEQDNIVEAEITTEAGFSFQDKYQADTGTIEQKIVPDTDTSCNGIAKEDDDSTSKNLNDDETTRNASFHSESSDEDDSIVISMNDEQAKPKYFVSCHVPTVFRPSLDPLRALRHRKPTTLQDRIALLESSYLKKSIRIDEEDDDQEKSKPVTKGSLNKSKATDEGKPLLTKAKSVLDKLTFEKVGSSEEKKHLRKSTSYTSLHASSSFNKYETYGDGLKDTLQELNSNGDNDPLQMKLDSLRFDSKLPLTRPDEIIEVLSNVEESSSTNMLEILCKEFSERLLKCENEDRYTKERNKKIASLTRLLVDSKRYLHPEKFPSDLVFSSNQPICCNPRILRRILPLKSYNLIAPVLGLPEFYPTKKATFDDVDVHHFSEKTTPEHDAPSSVEVHPPTPREIDSSGDQEKLGQRRYNPYALFLTKPRRKVVKWRPLTERDLEGYDPDATLKSRTDNIMDKIFHDFCQWVDSLGGTDKTIDEEVLRDMFEIDFDAEACRAMQVLIQEMPVVPTLVAIIRNSPGASKLAKTKKHVMIDAKAEKKPAKVVAFGTSIPWELRFVPPKNQVEDKWLRCENVPKDLETMDTVWRGITHLRSVKGFVQWLKMHPEVPEPEALSNIVSMDVITLKQTEDEEAFAHLELDINQIKSFRVANIPDSLS